VIAWTSPVIVRTGVLIAWTGSVIIRTSVLIAPTGPLRARTGGLTRWISLQSSVFSPQSSVFSPQTRRRGDHQGAVDGRTGESSEPANL
jgi:hypothetical protein